MGTPNKIPLTLGNPKSSVFTLDSEKLWVVPWRLNAFSSFGKPPKWKLEPQGMPNSLICSPLSEITEEWEGMGFSVGSLKRNFGVLLYNPKKHFRVSRLPGGSRDLEFRVDRAL